MKQYHNYIILILLTLLSSVATSEELTFRCNGNFDEIHIRNEIVFAPESQIDYRIAEGLEKDKRRKKSTAKVIFQILNGETIQTNAFGTSRSYQKFLIKECKVFNGKLTCQKDITPKNPYRIFNLIIEMKPPWYVNTTLVTANYPKKENPPESGLGNYLADNYNWERFSSTDCEQFSPLPSLSSMGISKQD